MPQLNGFHYAGVSLRFGSKVLLLRNKDRGTWELPGGHVDDTDQTYLAAALRELREETGLEVEGSPAWCLGQNPPGAPGAGMVFGFNIDRGDLPPSPTISAEHTEYGWFDTNHLPEDLQPCCQVPVQRWQMNENDICKLMQDGLLLGPSSYFNQVLFPVRITGTGIALRMGKMQYTFRDPEQYLTPEFVERCNGLNLLWQHAESDLTDQKTSDNQSIGTVVSSFVKNQEVWGVARILDPAVAQRIATGAYSTSPSFITAIESKSEHGGLEFTVEGQVIHLDHLAIVDMGVWDKLGEPSGVATPVTLRPIPLTFLKEYTMSEEKKVEAKHEDNQTRVDDGQHEDRFKKLEDSMASMRDSMTKLCDAMMPKKDAVTEPDLSKDGEEPAPMNEGASFGDEAPLPGDNASMDSETGMTAEALKHALAAKDAVIGSLQKQVDALACSMPKDLSDEDRNELSSAEAKADSVFLALGKSTPHPLMNENHMPYRRRVVKTLQQYSKRFGKVNLAALDAESFNSIEAEVYKDAMAAARSTDDVPAGGLLPVKRRSFGGREIIEYRGSPTAFLKPFSESPKRAKGTPLSIHRMQ